MRLTRFVFVCVSILATTAFAQTFKLTSTDIHQGKRIAATHVFNAMGCTGNNLSPELQWSGAPHGTKSFAVTVYDPNAPTGSGWWHWVVYNIPASVTKLERGAGDPGKHRLPEGQSRGTPTSELPDTADRVLPRATSRTTTSSPCSR